MLEWTKIGRMLKKKDIAGNKKGRGRQSIQCRHTARRSSHPMSFATIPKFDPSKFSKWNGLDWSHLPFTALMNNIGNVTFFITSVAGFIVETFVIFSKCIHVGWFSYRINNANCFESLFTRQQEYTLTFMKIGVYNCLYILVISKVQKLWCTFLSRYAKNTFVDVRSYLWTFVKYVE